MRTIAFTLAALAAAFTMTPALAGSSAPRTVAYADLDLSTDAGRAALERRVERAVAGVCGHAVAGHAVVNAGVANCRALTRARIAGQVQVAIAQDARRRRLAVR